MMSTKTPLKIGDGMPSIPADTQWLNRPNKEINMKHNFTLIIFWSRSCPACLLSFKYINDFHQKYIEAGIEIVLIHLPRSPLDEDSPAIEMIVEKYQANYSCALDHDARIADSFKLPRKTPYFCLFDRNQKLRVHAAPPIGLKLAEASLDRLITAKTELSL